MTDSNILKLPPDHRDPDWWKSSRSVVRWTVERELGSPLVTGVGTIQHPRPEPIESDDGDDAHYEKVGRIVVTKVPLGHVDAWMEMDAISADHEFLASQVFDGEFYTDAFFNWLMDELDVEIFSDPIFVLDLKIDERFSDPECAVAAHAALDALWTFGGSESPLMTFHREGVHPELRGSLGDEGLWTWVHALRAKRWEKLYVAVGPR